MWALTPTACLFNGCCVAVPRDGGAGHSVAMAVRQSAKINRLFLQLMAALEDASGAQVGKGVRIMGMLLTLSESQGRR
jgi:hypothetical protein